MLTKKQAKALAIIRVHGPIAAIPFANLMWPKSKTARGASFQGYRLNADQWLWKMYLYGLLNRDWEGEHRVYSLTNSGLATLRAYWP